MSKVLVMFHGKAGSGKTTNKGLLMMHLGALGYNVLQVKFADPVYKLHDVIQEEMSNYGFPVQTKHRLLLQLIGTEVGRKVYGNDVWARAAMGTALNFFRSWNESKKAAVVIDDCRFPEELEAASKLPPEIQVIKISLRAPEATRRERADQWPSNPNHESETALDYDVYRKQFDLTVQTTGGVEKDFERIRKYVDERLGERNPGVSEYEIAVDHFNKTIATIAHRHKLGANFGWDYTSRGVKQLRIFDTAPIVKPSDEMIAQAVAEVPDLIKQAEDLIVQTK